MGTGRKALGSTDNYINLGFHWRRYQPLQLPVRANLNMQLLFGFNHGREDEFELGGADTMRGILDDDKLIGDMFALLNLNWLIPQGQLSSFSLEYLHRSRQRLEARRFQSIPPGKHLRRRCPLETASPGQPHPAPRFGLQSRDRRV